MSRIVGEGREREEKQGIEGGIWTFEGRGEYGGEGSYQGCSVRSCNMCPNDRSGCPIDDEGKFEYDVCYGDVDYVCEGASRNYAYGLSVYANA